MTRAILFATLLAATLAADGALIPMSIVKGVPVPSGSGNTLAWTPPTTNLDSSGLSDLTSYRIWRGTTSGVYTVSTTIAAPASSYTPTGLTSSVTYYFRVSAVDADGNEGWLTDAEVSFTAP